MAQNYLLTALIKVGTDRELSYFWFESEEKLRDAIKSSIYGILEVKEAIYIKDSEQIII